METKYLCRMHSIEIVHWTDAHASERGFYVARRKRSYDTSFGGRHGFGRVGRGGRGACNAPRTPTE